MDKAATGKVTVEVLDEGCSHLPLVQLATLPATHLLGRLLQCADCGTNFRYVIHAGRFGFDEDYDQPTKEEDI